MFLTLTICILCLERGAGKDGTLQSGFMGKGVISMREECQECGSQLKVRRWRENEWIVEELKECPVCGWTRHWAYGMVITEDGDDDATHT